MAQYLDKFRGVIGKVQARQVLDLLNKKRDTGEIRTVGEFSARLEDLMRELTSTQLTPSLKLYPAEENQKINSSTYNFQLDRVQDDLIASFEEAKQIDEVQRSHEAIVRDVLLKNLRAAAAELEGKISLYEFIQSDTHGFASAVFSTFREIKDEQTLRGDVASSVFFTDQRTRDLIPGYQDAEIQLIGDRLVLPRDNVSYWDLKGVRQIFDAGAIQSEFIVDPPDLVLTNIIDGKVGTYWAQALLFAANRQEVRTKIEVNLGAVREVNFFEVEPISRQGLTLETIQYLDNNQALIDLGINEIVLTKPVSIQSKKIATRRLVFTFKNTNSTRVGFEYNDQTDTLFYQALEEPAEGIDPSVNLVATYLNDLISSEQLKEILSISVPESKSFTGYEFLIGIDNIRVGLSDFQEQGIYVSKAIELPNVGELGLKVEENRPYELNKDILHTSVTYDLGTRTGLDGSAIFSSPDDIYFLGSIEYSVIKQDFNMDGILYRTSVFPILPLNVNRIYHERLLLTKKSSTSVGFLDEGYTRFFTNTTATEGNLKVYKNGVELTEDTDWVDETAVADRTPDNNQPMRFVIRLLAKPQAADYLTVSYNPVISNTASIPQTLSELTTLTGLKIVDLVGDLSARHFRENVILTDTEAREGEITSKAYLQIILRSNTTKTFLTPSVEEYTLLAGYKDSSKFREI